jgi:hypothetical protein
VIATPPANGPARPWSSHARAGKGNSTSDGGRELITLPDWLPPAVARQARLIEARCSSAEHQAILLRLATNTRMKDVWKELSRRNRSGGGFLHPAKWRLDKPVLLERVYGHHHPDFQREVAEKMSGQDRDRNTPVRLQSKNSDNPLYWPDRRAGQGPCECFGIHPRPFALRPERADRSNKRRRNSVPACSAAIANLRKASRKLPLAG